MNKIDDLANDISVGIPAVIATRRKQEEWYFSVVDVVEVLTDSTNPTDYLKKLRKRDNLLGDYIGTNCPQVAMPTETGKQRKTSENKINPTLNSN